MVTADLVSDIRRLCRDGRSVLVVIRGTDPSLSSALLAAGAYLKRVKEKYQQVGRPAYTKLELALRVREDNLGIAVERALPPHGDGVELKVNPRGTYLIEVTVGSADGSAGGYDQSPRSDDRSEVALSEGRSSGDYF